MRKTYILLALAPAIALAACGQKDDSASNVVVVETPAGMDAVVATPVPGSPAQNFVDLVTASNHYEVEAGKLAQERATTDALKNFGKLMVTGHTDAASQLTVAAAQANPPLTSTAMLNAEQEANLAKLRQLNGAEFDAAYKAQQVASHEQALALTEGYAANGEVESLKTYAANTAKAVKMHLDRIKGM